MSEREMDELNGVDRPACSEPSRRVSSDKTGDEVPLLEVNHDSRVFEVAVEVDDGYASA
jgi:hypothetical protein